MRHETDVTDGKMHQGADASILQAVSDLTYNWLSRATPGIMQEVVLGVHSTVR